MNYCRIKICVYMCASVVKKYINPLKNLKFEQHAKSIKTSGYYVFLLCSKKQ